MKDKEQAPSTALPNPLCAGGQSSHATSSLTKEEEEVCPICLSELVDGESMTVCKEGCENRLHHHCMAVWAEECRRRKEQLNCPLCRTIWQLRKTRYSSERNLTRLAFKLLNGSRLGHNNNIQIMKSIMKPVPSHKTVSLVKSKNHLFATNEAM